MTGVVAALITDDDIRVLGKQIDNFAFSFIAPLSADDCYVCHWLCNRQQVIGNRNTDFDCCNRKAHAYRKILLQFDQS